MSLNVARRVPCRKPTLELAYPLCVFHFVSGQLPTRTIPHGTGIGPDNWLYQLVVVLVGSCPRDRGAGGQHLTFICICWRDLLELFNFDVPVIFHSACQSREFCSICRWWKLHCDPQLDRSGPLRRSNWLPDRLFPVRWPWRGRTPCRRNRSRSHRWEPSTWHRVHIHHNVNCPERRGRSAVWKLSCDCDLYHRYVVRHDLNQLESTIFLCSLFNSLLAV